MLEVWKDIEGYEGLYQVSTCGRVKSLPRNTTRGGILKYKKYKTGYLGVQLSKNGKIASVLVHRLVAKAFIPNPSGFPEVNHKDLNKQNNDVSNLEWCTSQYNVDYSNSKRVYQYDKQGNLIRIWKSTKEIERQLKIRNDYISACCNGRLKTSCGYVWKYE